MKNIINKRPFKCVLVILANVLAIYVIASFISHFISGSTSQLLIPTQAIENNYIYTPTEIIYNSEYEGSAENSFNLEQLKRDLTDAESYLYKSSEINEIINIEKHFTDSSYNYLSDILDQDDIPYDQNIANLYHQLHIHLISNDRKVAVMTDSAHVSIQKLSHDDQVISKHIDTSIIRYVLLMEEGNWKIHKRKVLHTKRAEMGSLEPENRIHIQQSALAGIKGINYYPQATPWKNFWLEYNEDVTRKDLRTIKNLNIQSIRIFIPYFDVRDLKLKNTIIQNCQDFLTQCADQNIKVVVTLFDFYEGVESYRWGNHMNYIDTLTFHLSAQEGLWMWDLKNEPDIDFQYHGKEYVKDWCEYFSFYLKKKDPKHPITIGWAHHPRQDFLNKHLDVISFHHYGNASSLQELIKKQKSYDDRPIIITEVGRSTYHGLWSPFGYDEEAQVEYYKNLNTVKSQDQIPYFAWTLYDFDSIPEGIVPNRPWIIQSQMKFGLLDKNGVPKKSAEVIKNDVANEKLVPPFFIFRNSNMPVFGLLFILALIIITLLILSNRKK